MTTRTLALCAALTLLGAAPAAAIPAPQPADELERMASDVIQGRIDQTTLVDVTTQGNYRVTLYESLVRVYRVEKGRLKPGATIRFRWSLEAWVGKGRRPPGRTPRPYFGVCDHLRLYLSGGAKGVYALAYYNGWKRLSGGMGKAPTRKGLTVKCRQSRTR